MFGLKRHSKSILSLISCSSYSMNPTEVQCTTHTQLEYSSQSLKHIFIYKLWHVLQQQHKLTRGLSLVSMKCAVPIRSKTMREYVNIGTIGFWFVITGNILYITIAIVSWRFKAPTCTTTDWSLPLKQKNK